MTKVGVIQFPGSNDERDAVWAVRLLGGEADLIWHGSTDLRGADAIILPGGFSYGDYLRTGAIARFAAVMDAVAEFARAGGPVLGVCNGFQILCEGGLLPGALTRNEGLSFVCRPQPIRVENAGTAWTAGAQAAQVLTIPIKHGEGRFVADPAVLRELQEKGQIVFRYCDADGSDGGNPNGSLADVAGVCNEAGNVVGMMPHPEHAVDSSAGIGSADGRLVIGSVVQAAAEVRA